MRDLLEAFVTDEWVSEADFCTLQISNGTYITDDLRSRADDIIWRIRCGEHLVYLLVEFQSTADRFMAVRVLTYVGLLYQQLIRESNGRDLDELPAILPIVLHSGRRPWSAAEDVSALVSDSPHGLGKYRPRLCYLLIDQTRYDDTELASRRNFAAMLFRIENCRRREVMRQLVGTLLEWLQDPGLEDLRRAFVAWLKKVVWKRLPGKQASAATELWEKPGMLSEAVEEWEKELREEGWQIGHQAGRQEGRREGLQMGLRQALANLLKKRFGELPELIQEPLDSASVEQLECWSECLLDAGSLDDVVHCMQLVRTDN